MVFSRGKSCVSARSAHHPSQIQFDIPFVLFCEVHVWCLFNDERPCLVTGFQYSSSVGGKGVNIDLYKTEFISIRMLEREDRKAIAYRVHAELSAPVEAHCLHHELYR